MERVIATCEHGVAKRAAAGHRGRPRANPRLLHGAPRCGARLPGCRGRATPPPQHARAKSLYTCDFVRVLPVAAGRGHTATNGDPWPPAARAQAFACAASFRPTTRTPRCSSGFEVSVCGEMCCPGALQPGQCVRGRPHFALLAAVANSANCFFGTARPRCSRWTACTARPPRARLRPCNL